MMRSSSRPTGSTSFVRASRRSSPRGSPRASGSTSPVRGRPTISFLPASMSEDSTPDEENLEGGTLVLGDLLNRVLDKGVVISGHVTISIANIDLLALDLKLLLTSIETVNHRRRGAPAPREGGADPSVLSPRNGS